MSLSILVDKCMLSNNVLYGLVLLGGYSVIHKLFWTLGIRWKKVVAQSFHIKWASFVLHSKWGSGIPRRGGFGRFNPHLKFWSFDKAEPNSQFRGKYICNNLIKIWVSPICKLSGTPGPPDPRSLYPLSQTEFVEPPPSPEKNSWVCHWSGGWGTTTERYLNVWNCVWKEICIPIACLKTV
jgi:hypothetical protein